MNDRRDRDAAGCVPVVTWVEQTIGLLAVLILAYALFGTARPVVTVAQAPASTASVLALPKTVAVATTMFALDTATIEGTPILVGDRRNVVVALPYGESVRLTGWAADSKTNDAARDVVIEAGRSRFDAVYGGRRPDVSAAFHNGALIGTGFDAVVESTTLGAGRFPISLAIVSSDGRTLYRTKPLVTLNVR